MNHSRMRVIFGAERDDAMKCKQQQSEHDINAPPVDLL